MEKKEELGRSLKEITVDMVPAFKRVMKNKALSCLIVGDIFLFLQVGSYSFHPKIYALIFRYYHGRVQQCFCNSLLDSSNRQMV